MILRNTMKKWEFIVRVVSNTALGVLLLLVGLKGDRIFIVFSVIYFAIIFLLLSKFWGKLK